MQHLYPRLLCQHSTWLKHQTVNQPEPKYILTEYLTRILDVSWGAPKSPPPRKPFNRPFNLSDALQLSIPAQGLANGDATLPAYPGIQPYPGVGELNWHFLMSVCLYVHLFYWISFQTWN